MPRGSIDWANRARQRKSARCSDGSFGYPLLRDVAGTDEPALQIALDRLVEADLLLVEGAPPQAVYRFKHALIQDAAYDSLLKSRRQALHRRAAELLRDDPERATAEPEIIARHFTQAGLDDLAIEWWGKAGDQALRRSAFQEAIAHLGKAIAMADRAGATAASDRRLDRPPTPSAADAVARRLGNALIAARGYGATETTEAFARAREFAAGDKNAPGRLAADYGLWVGSFTRGELPSMRAHAAAFLSDVEARPDSPRPASPIAPPGSPAGSPASIARRGITLEGRSPCSNPAATMIWPFVSDWTLASPRWPIWRLRRGLSARSIARFRSLTACRRGWRASPMSARSRLEECTRPRSN